MRSKNQRAIDTLESAYIADVKRCACVVCGAPAPSQAHHVVQGDHFTTCALCPDCHGGPGYQHGWHGDKSRWRVAKMTELSAINETRRAVERLRSGKPVESVTQQRTGKSRSNLSSSKIIPRAA